MTRLYFTATTSRPAAILPPPSDEPTWLELQRWEDDGGAVPPERAPTSRPQRRFGSLDLDQAAA